MIACQIQTQEKTEKGVNVANQLFFLPFCTKNQRKKIKEKVNDEKLNTYEKLPND